MLWTCAGMREGLMKLSSDKIPMWRHLKGQQSMQCPECQKDYEDSFKFCPHCAAPNPSSSQTTVASPEKARHRLSRKWKIVLVVGTGVMLILGLTLGLVFGLSGTVVGVYDYGEYGTMTLHEDGTVTSSLGEIDGKYLVEGKKVTIWNHASNKVIKLRIVGDDLVRVDGSALYKRIK